MMLRRKIKLLIAMKNEINLQARKLFCKRRLNFT